MYTEHDSSYWLIHRFTIQDQIVNSGAQKQPALIESLFGGSNNCVKSNTFDGQWSELAEGWI